MERSLTLGQGPTNNRSLHSLTIVLPKGGIENLTKVCAVELGPLGIRVNCVAPGAIEIERTKLEAGDYAGTWGSITPMRRVGQAQDVAAVVAFLASDAAEFTTGQTVYVDGGLWTAAQWPYSSDD